MKNKQTPHYFSIFPTGAIPIPVNIGELPLFDYVVSEDVFTEHISAHLENNPQIPGVVI